jgi:probable phosphoglycerate mutase
MHRHLLGRLPHVGLTRRGRRQATALPQRLELYATSIAALYVSPQQRAAETAEPIGRAYSVAPQPMDGLAEVDFGAWTGLSFAELDRDPAWRDYNAHRATAVVPLGESAVDLHHRVVRALTEIATTHAGAMVAVVTHAEIIRTIVLHCSGRSLDEFHTVAIDPASISSVELGDTARLLFANSLDGERRTVRQTRAELGANFRDDRIP